MPITSIHCHVLGMKVNCVTDLDGAITQIACTEYDPVTRICRTKREARAGGPLAQLFGRIADDTLAGRGIQCDLR